LLLLFVIISFSTVSTHSNTSQCSYEATFLCCGQILTPRRSNNHFDTMLLLNANKEFKWT